MIFLVLAFNISFSFSLTHGSWRSSNNVRNSKEILYQIAKDGIHMSIVSTFLYHDDDTHLITYMFDNERKAYITYK